MIKSKKYTGVYYKQLTNDKSYYITYKHNGKKVWLKIGLHSEGVREAYCFKKRAEVTASIRLGELPDFVKNKKQKIFHEVIDEFFEHKRYPKKTAHDYMMRYKNYIAPVIGDMPLKQITKKDILSLHDKALQKVSLKTARLIVDFTGSVFIYAIEKRYTDKNPCKKLPLPKIDNTRDRYLDKKEIEQLLEECRADHDLLLFVMLALTTGGRLGAICAIKKKDIMISSMTINLLDDKNDETYQAFLSSKVLPLLNLDDLSPNDSIFTKQQRTIQRKLQTILNRLFNQGLEKNDRKNRVVVHTLRHTFASHLAINGTPIFTIQRLMNHKDITHTLRYAKLAPDSGRDMVEGIL
jgi:integrase